MSDQSSFKFLKLPTQPDWIVLSPSRAARLNVAKKEVQVCPFCTGGEEEELLRVRVGQSVSESENQKNEDWLVRVLPNKYPFASIHELIIHSPDHHKNLDELPQEQVELVLKVLQQRFNLHKKAGQVCIFHNRGVGGESLPHPHTQLAVVPFDIPINSPLLSEIPQDAFKTNNFAVFSPSVCQWPDEVWLAPLTSGKYFGEIIQQEMAGLSVLLPKVIQLLDLRHGHEFPFNYTIYPGKNWFIRLVPRQKILGGFEIGTGIFVNTQESEQTNKFMREHLTNFDPEKILREQQATYHRSV